MNVSNFETLTQKIAVQSINVYQQHISPKKGFACPHRVLYGGLSCSEYVKDLLLYQELTSVVRLSVKRFHNCGLASEKLQKSQGGCIVIPCCIPI